MSEKDEARTPAEYLKALMAERNLSAVTLAEKLGVHVQTIYNVTGKEPRKISSRLAVALAKYFGHDVDFWLAETIPAGTVDLGAPSSAQAPEEDVEPQRTRAPRDQVGQEIGIMVDSQLRAALGERGSGLEIRPHEGVHVRPATIDLTVGRIVVRGYEHLKRDILTQIVRYELFPEVLSQTERESAETMIDFYAKEIDIRDSYTLKPNESVVVISREDLAFSENFAGRVGQNTSLLLEGCQVIHGLQIDPGFSGPLFVRAINLRPKESFTLSTGDVLLSVEVVRLAKAPAQAHRGTLDRRIAHVTENVDRVIGDLFTYKSSAVGEAPYKATFKGEFEKSFVRKDDEDVRAMAVAWIVATLADASSVARTEIATKVEEAMDSIPVVRDEAEALMISASVATPDHPKVLNHFDGDKAQSLRDTIRWMDKKPIDIAISLLGHDAARERAWSSWHD